MRKIVAVIVLELYAGALATLQFLNGLHTDEAKYLLNIPYPHPPFARFLLHALDGFAYQEFFWRFLLASLCVQAAWLVFFLLQGASRSVRIALMCCWLFSTPIILQAGTIMMAPITALEAWLFSYYWLQEEDHRKNAGFLGLLWIVSLFTAYQAILFAPLVSALICRHTTRFWYRVAYIVFPVLLLILYTLTNPLVPASVLVHSGDAPALSVRLHQLLFVWLLGGSAVLSVAGFYALVRYKMWPFLFSFFWVCAYVFLAQYDYYAILFLPLLMAGVLVLVREWDFLAWPLSLGVLVLSAYYCFGMTSLVYPPSPVRHIMQGLAAEHISGPILIEGAFGHDWQYESMVPLLRYQAALLPKARAVICISACSILDGNPTWRRISSTLPIVFVRQTP